MLLLTDTWVQMVCGFAQVGSQFPFAMGPQCLSSKCLVLVGKVQGIQPRAWALGIHLVGPVYLWSQGSLEGGEG